MAEYESPSSYDLTQRTGLGAEGQTNGDQDEFEGLFAFLLPYAEADVALTVGETEFDSTERTEREVSKLQGAVLDRVAFLIQVRGLNKRLTGEFDPLQVAQVGEILDALRTLTAPGSPLNTTEDAASNVGDFEAGGMPALQVGTLTFPEQ